MDKQKAQVDTQQRTPRGKEIPVPKKGEVLDALRNAAHPRPGKPANEGPGEA